MTQSSIIILHLNEYTEGLHYYPFEVNLDRCVVSYNTLNDLFNKICVPNKTENLNVRFYDDYRSKQISKSKISTKHVSCECKCKLDGRKCNSNQN